MKMKQQINENFLPLNSSTFFRLKNQINLGQDLTSTFFRLKYNLTVTKMNFQLRNGKPFRFNNKNQLPKLTNHITQ